MKINLSVRTLFILAFLIVAVTNVIVLSGVAVNRSGEPGSIVMLTERELKLPDAIQKENSGLSLRLAWGVGIEDNHKQGFSSRLNAEKLKSLGFNTEEYSRFIKDKTDFHKQLITTKEVFLVLEYDGETHKRWVKQAEIQLENERTLEKQKKIADFSRVKGSEIKLQRLRKFFSRLFVIDAGIDPEILRKKYQERTRFIITKGFIALNPRSNWGARTQEIYGEITGLNINSIQIPLEHKPFFETFLNSKTSPMEAKPPRYKVEIAYGSRFEPWIVSVQSINE